jgi:hypothetical protein
MADYERKDSNYKAKHGKEPQKLHPTMSAGKPSSLRKLQQDRLNRRAIIANKLKDLDKEVL